MRSRPGIALVLALFVLVLLEAMTVGVCALSLQSKRVAHARARMTRARVAADDDLASIFKSWSSWRLDTLPVGATAILRRGMVERTGPSSFLATAVEGGQRRIAVARFLDRRRAIDETIGRVVPDTSLALGGVRWSEVSSIADTVDGPGAPLLYAHADLVLNGGFRRGILIADGSITLIGTIYEGVVVARGPIRLEAGAAIVGAARSRDFGGYVVPGVLASDSVVSAVLLETPSAARLILQQRRYIPGF